MKYRKKPIVIEAMQYDGKNCVEVLKFMGKQNDYADLTPFDIPIIYTLEGELTASVGDWIIKGIKGEFYPCKPDIFEATYEPA